MLQSKPTIEACLRNRDPILEKLRPLLTNKTRLLEVGSGTGQHAVYFAKSLPNIIWQPTDLLGKLPGINQWIAESGLTNILPPIALNVEQSDWKLPDRYDALFTSNTLHIMNEAQVACFFRHAPQYLKPQAVMCIYGPFNENGEFTSQGNYALDARIKQANPLSGIKDRQQIIHLAEKEGFQLIHCHKMPANNWLLEFRLTNND